MHLDEVAGDRQAEPETPAAAHGRGVALLERLEDAREEIGTDAAAGVRDDDADASGLGFSVRSVTRPPWGVNLVAFLRRFQKIC